MYYTSKVKCLNCGFSDTLEIPEGLLVSDLPCPECKTKSLTIAPKEKPQEEEIKPDKK